MSLRLLLLYLETMLSTKMHSQSFKALQDITPAACNLITRTSTLLFAILPPDICWRQQVNNFLWCVSARVCVCVCIWMYVYACVCGCPRWRQHPNMYNAVKDLYFTFVNAERAKRIWHLGNTTVTIPRVQLSSAVPESHHVLTSCWNTRLWFWASTCKHIVEDKVRSAKCLRPEIVITVFILIMFTCYKPRVKTVEKQTWGSDSSEILT